MGRRHAGALPAMRLHKQSGQARIRIDGREHRLGPFGSAEAQVRYDQLLAAYLASGRTSVEAAPAAPRKTENTPEPDPADLTIGDLCVRWIKTIQDDRDDWKSSSKYQGALAAARALRPVAAMPAPREVAMPMKTVLVTTVTVADDVTLAAWWDGGREIRVHRDAGGAVHVVARWAVWNDAWDCPLIDPTRESFERFVRGRLDEPGVLHELLVEPAAAGQRPDRRRTGH